ncbi:MAG: BamA/TamA family outer membrane protein [Myxococcota bacterium]|nr:BamA/TamA family outer membrane protein [Myxococcota bacterium]
MSLFGCAKHPTQATVAKITFEGNGSSWSTTSDYALKSAMLSKENEPLAFLQPETKYSFVDVEALQLDAWRIENWYANQGYINARFIGWDIRTRPSILWGLARKNQVHIVGQVQEGEPVIVRQVKLSGGNFGRIQKEQIGSLNTQTPGSIISMDSLTYSRDLMLSKLQEDGYSRAKVELDVNVWPANCEELPKEHRLDCQLETMKYNCSQNKRCELRKLNFTDCRDLECLEQSGLPKYKPSKSQSADVVFSFEKGSINTIGKITIEADIETNIDRFLESIPLKEGERFAPSKLVGAQRYFYSLGIFSVVNVVPDMTTEDSALPITITLQENLPRQAKLGVGLSLESGMQEAHISTGLLHRNLFQYVVRLDTNAQIGYAVIPDPDKELFNLNDEGSSGLNLETNLEDKFENKAPVGLVQTQMTVPRVFDSLWSVQLDAQYEEGLEPTFRFRSPEVSPSLSYPLSIKKWGIQGIDIQLGYHYIFFSYITSALDPALINNSALGLDNQPQYSLSYISQRINIDGRDNPINPTKGWSLSFNFQEAGRFLGGGYDYWRTTEEFRYYFPLISVSNWKPFGTDKSIRRRRLEKNKAVINPKGVFAMRGVTGFIFPYLNGVQGVSPAPYAEHIFLGGSSNVRGWGKNRLGPYVCEGCLNDNGRQVSADIVPIGGTASLWGSLEYRHYTADGYGVVLFNDWGMLWELPEEFNVRELSPSVGIGGRYRSPIGSLRLDVARNLNQDARFAAEDNWTVHFSMAEAF